MKSISIIFIFIAFSVAAQVEKQHSIGAGLSFGRMDFYLQGSYQRQYERLELSAGAGVGIIRTFFQGRIFPKIFLRSSYYFLNKPKLQLGPTVSMDYSGIRLNNQNPWFNFWQQYAVGYCFTAGNRIQFFHIAEIGPQLESYYSEYEQHYKTATTLGYSLQIGLRYVL